MKTKKEAANVLWQNTETVYMTLEQFNANRDLIVKHDDIMYLKEDGREVLLDLKTGDNTICPVRILTDLLSNVVGINTMFMNDEQYSGEYTKKLLSPTIFAYSAVDDLISGAGEQYRSYFLHDIDKQTLARLNAMRDRGHSAKIIAELEEQYPKEAGCVQLYKKTVNRALLAGVIDGISYLMINTYAAMNDDEKNSDFFCLGLIGYVIVANLRDMNREETIRFVQENVKSADRECIEFLINQYTLQS